MLLVGISALITAMGVSWATTPAVVALAKRLGALDMPGGASWAAEARPGKVRSVSTPGSATRSAFTGRGGDSACIV